MPREITIINFAVFCYSMSLELETSVTSALQSTLDAIVVYVQERINKQSLVNRKTRKSELCKQLGLSEDSVWLLSDSDV